MEMHKGRMRVQYAIDPAGNKYFLNFRCLDPFDINEFDRGLQHIMHEINDGKGGDFGYLA